MAGQKRQSHYKEARQEPSWLVTQQHWRKLRRKYLFCWLAARIDKKNQAQKSVQHTPRLMKLAYSVHAKPVFVQCESLQSGCQSKFRIAATSAMKIEIPCCRYCPRRKAWHCAPCITVRRKAVWEASIVALWTYIYFARDFCTGGRSRLLAR